jgi:hypothetical protein
MFRITLGVSHEVSHLCTPMARNAFTCGSLPCGMLSIPPWWDVTPTTTTATLPRLALVTAQARRPTEMGKSKSLPWWLQRYSDKLGWTSERVPAYAGLEDGGGQVNGPGRPTIYLRSDPR